VLAHELAHSLVARAYGVDVREIRLFLFGGVSNIAHEPPSPKAEVAITVVGPLTSIAFGVAMSVIASLLVGSVPDPARVTETIAAMGPIATLLTWLGSINVLVGLFNLVPGFPLDGGRLLRALVWWSTHDLRRATRVAATVGQVVGWTFAGLGVLMFTGIRVPFFGAGFVSGMWLVFIGWFLASAARASQANVVLHDALDGVRVGQIMRRAGSSMPPDTTVEDAVRLWFMRAPEHAFPVVDPAGALVGIVSRTDVNKIPRDGWTATRVSSVMTPVERLALATPDEPATTALEALARRDVDQLPVVRDLATRELVGMFERVAIARWIELRAGQNLRPRPT